MFRFKIPSGKKTGCLPRASKVGDVCDLFADKIKVIPQSRWKKLIGKINLRPYVNQILDQNGVGSCATESTTQGEMIAREFGNQPFELLNPWFIYHHTSGGRDRGSNIDSNLVFARDKGIVPESVWPRSKGFRAKPTAAAYEAALKYRIEEFFDITSVEEVGTALLSGMAVVFGWSGHSCIMTSLKSETTAEYANSWAPTWGDKGFGTIRLASINWSYGAFAIRSVTDSGETKS